MKETQGEIPSSGKIQPTEQNYQNPDQIDRYRQMARQMIDRQIIEIQILGFCSLVIKDRILKTLALKYLKCVQTTKVKVYP